MQKSVNTSKTKLAIAKTDKEGNETRPRRGNEARPRATKVPHPPTTSAESQMLWLRTCLLQLDKPLMDPLTQDDFKSFQFALLS